MITKIGLVVNDTTLFNSLTNHFSKNKKQYNLEFYLKNGRECKDSLNKSKNNVDVFILEAVLPYINGTDIAREIYFSGRYLDSPGIIIISSLQQYDIFLEDMDMNRVSFLLKPVDLNYIDKEIIRIQRNKFLTIPCNERKRLRGVSEKTSFYEIKKSKYNSTEKLVTNILNDFGINQKYKGSKYLKDAILISVFEGERYDFQMKSIIIQVAKYYNRPSGSIHSLISKTVNIAKFDSSKYKDIIFSESYSSKKLTPKEFIFTVSEFVRLEVKWTQCYNSIIAEVTIMKNMKEEFEDLVRITEEEIERINELAKKSKSKDGLTDNEIEEQKHLRRKYIDSFKANLKNHLDIMKK